MPICRKATLITASVLISACLTMAAPAASAKGTNLVDGVYEGTGTGMGGSFPITITIENAAITKVSIGENHETGGVGSIAVETIPDRIVDAQSLEVDTIAGATVTSRGILNGVKKILSDNGMSLASAEVPQKAEKAVGEEEKTDVVIVGAGLSGLMAAYELKYQHPDVSYILLEKLDYVTGSLPFSGGAIVGLKSDYLAKAHMESDMEDLFDVLESGSGHKINREFAQMVYSHSEEVMNRYLDWGMPVLDAELSNPDASEKLAFLQADSSGSDFALFMQQHVKDDPLNLRMHSKVTELLTENNQVVGVKVEDPEKIYTIKADAVLLATGGFGSNPELVQKYSPVFSKATPFTGANGTGDGFLLTEKFHPEIVGQGMMGAEISPNYEDEYGMNSALGSYFIVNEHGERFARDDIGTEITLIAAENGYRVFNILDSKYEDKAGIEDHIQNGEMQEFDSLESLAETMGIDAERLEQTVQNYNKSVDSGEDAFGLANHPLKIDAAPYYCEELYLIGGYFGSVPGVKVDNAMHLLDGDGNIVKGVYCSGELTEGNLWENDYPGSGIAISYASYSGAYAIDSILEDIR